MQLALDMSRDGATWMMAAIVVLAFLGMFGLVFLLQMLSTQGRRAIVVAVTFIAGLIFALEFFLPAQPVDGQDKNFLSDPTLQIQNFLQVVAGMALGLGTYGLLRLHLRNVVQKRAQWGYSASLLISLVVMGFLSIWHSLGEKNVEGQPLVATNETAEYIFSVLFNNMIVQMDAAMFSLIAFYIFSAAYRAFRIRSIEATILMATAMIVMIGIVPLGKAISEGIGLPAELPPDYAKDPFSLTAILYSLKLPTMADWILKTLNAPATRAIEFGVAVGGLATAIRLWLSMDRGLGV